MSAKWEMHWPRNIQVLCASAATLLLALPLRASVPVGQPSLILVVGAAGEEEFGRQFEEWAQGWERAARQGSARLSRIGSATNSTASAGADDSSDREQLQAALEAETKDGGAELWLVFIGHGTFDGRNAKFNLRGTDFSDADLDTWLKPFSRPLAVINTSAASAPFIKALSGPGRVIVTATRSGNEQNFAYFGRYISEAIKDLKADLDKDGQVSLLEAFLTAARRTAEFYDVDGRLATEHAIVDDNGDGLGTPADFFRGLRAVKKAAEGAALDGLRAHQFHLVRSATEAEMPAELRAKRDGLELKIHQLREQKAALEENDYYGRLEKLLIELSKLYEAAESGK